MPDDDDILFVKTDVWQVSDGFEWTCSVKAWGERATGHTNNEIDALLATQKVITAWAAKHDVELAAGLLVVRVNHDSVSTEMRN